MHMKSYFANSVQDAMARAQREMGPDAILVTSRATAEHAKHMGAYEVVVAADLPDRAPAPSASERPEERPKIPPASGVDDVLGEMRRIQGQIASLRRLRARDGGLPAWFVGDPAIEEAYVALLDADVEPELALELMARVQSRLRTEVAAAEVRSGLRRVSRGESVRDSGTVRTALRTAMQQVCSVDATLGATSSGPRIIALVGPAGAGKTTTIAKLALQYGLAARKRSVLISIDTLRIGACEALRTYAAILGIGFVVADNHRSLEQTIEEHRSKDYIFIDTPGLGFRDLEAGSDAADFLARREDIQKHLVLPASLRPGDLSRVSSALQIFRPSRLLCTRIDEAEVLGPVFSEAVRTALPISFFTDGQRVPEDLRPATLSNVIDRILPQTESRESQQYSAA